MHFEKFWSQLKTNNDLKIIYNPIKLDSDGLEKIEFDWVNLWEYQMKWLT